MSSLGALDVIISLVVVLILLSLVVQSLQQLVKKVLKLKSRTIESSLVDLLGKVVTPIGASGAGGAGGPGLAGSGGLAQGRGAIRRMFGKARAEETLVVQVVDELKSLGRRSLFNRAILDSIAKDDVLKVMTKIGASRMYPAYQQRFQQVKDALDALVAAVKASQSPALRGSASARLAELQSTLAPLVYDLQALADPADGQGKVRATAVLGDLINVRRLHPQAVFDLLGQVQDQVSQDIAAAKAAGEDATGLETVAGSLRDAAQALKHLGETIEDAIAPLSAKLDEVDRWYDTVMQGFGERYARHMKTVATAIAIVTVLALNANFFRIYEAIAHDSALQASLAAAGANLVKAKPGNDGTAATTAPAIPQTTESPAPAPAAPAGASAGPQTPDQGTTVQEVQQAAQGVERNVQAYAAFGFQRLQRQDLRRFWVQRAPWSPNGSGQWGPWLGEGLSVLFGWLITILLLSAGAPFWEDVLEALFGLKGLVRQKTSTQNVEDGSGGQPKP